MDLTRGNIPAGSRATITGIYFFAKFAVELAPGGGETETTAIRDALEKLSGAGQALEVRRVDGFNGKGMLVNAISAPRYAWRGLYVTAALYAVFWVNALVSLRHWRRLVAQGR